MIPTATTSPEPLSARSLALEELGQLAALDPDREPAVTPTTRAPRAPRRPAADDDVVEPGELRRSLLADLSDLAHEPAQRVEM
jgi:hypothetical protein